MNKKIVFEKDAFDEYIYWQKNDRKILHKINELIKDIQRNGALQGIGKPERLKGDLSNLYSRRINKEHRLVYFIENDSIFITACKTHYYE
ncbi:Txe/YoeB family addiction module toxin [uncultured Brachyspira sp.]|uniref:Txe/YoeB family addiction module toxin n=1 Tax=uncultured Brachyspira sp. TaxID=221953 RepID=UPI0025D8130D|nr:Txe/YoeB family addiction module toxin [uncultured Brachyspira sp.]